MRQINKKLIFSVCLLQNKRQIHLYFKGCLYFGRVRFSRLFRGHNTRLVPQADGKNLPEYNIFQNTFFYENVGVWQDD